jgi:hypothetical protein
MRLTDILHNGEGDDIRQLWTETKAAGDIGPLPAGEYVCHIVGGDLETSRTNATPGYKMTFRVVEGPLAGRQFWHDCWLTAAALPQTKRDLSKIGVSSLDQLEQPLPRFIRCKCKLALRRDDFGIERNRLVRFDVIGIDPPEQDPFAPEMQPEPGPDSHPQTTQAVEGGERVSF